MKRILLTSTLAAGLAAANGAANTASAALITGFSQEAQTNTVAATDNGSTTTITISNALTTLGGGLFNVSGATTNLSATSVGSAAIVGGNVVQAYSGTFCISSGADCTGNFLKGVFTDAAFGGVNGPGLTINANNPPELLTLTSNVVPASLLVPPNAVSFGFSNLTPTLHIDGSTIGAFQASFAGTVSSEAAVPAPEPSSLAVLGFALAGLAGFTAFARHRS